MPPLLTQEQIHEIMEQSRIIQQHLQAVQINPLIRQTIDLHNLFAANNDIAISTLATQIRQNRHYVDLTDEMLSEIVATIRERFPEVENYTIENWVDEVVLGRLIALQEYVKTTLQERLHINRVGWGVVTRIINAVFGNVPVINQNLQRKLHDLGYLHFQNTSRLHTILRAICDFWQSISPILVPILSDLAITALCHACIGGVQAAIVAVLLRDIWQYCCNENNNHPN